VSDPAGEAVGDSGAGGSGDDGLAEVEGVVDPTAVAAASVSGAAGKLSVGAGVARDAPGSAAEQAARSSPARTLHIGCILGMSGTSDLSDRRMGSQRWQVPLRHPGALTQFADRQCQ
jgi:hypothetical protein